MNLASTDSYTTMREIPANDDVRAVSIPRGGRVMKLRSWILLLAFILLAATFGARITAQQQVTLCHRPPGNSSNGQTLTVSQGAAQSHFAHGDTAGPCPQSPKK